MMRLVFWEIQNNKRTVFLSVLLLCPVLLTVFFSAFSMVFWERSSDSIAQTFSKNNYFLVSKGAEADTGKQLQASGFSGVSDVKTYGALCVCDNVTIQLSLLDVSSSEEISVLWSGVQKVAEYGTFPSSPGEILLTVSHARAMAEEYRAKGFSSFSLEDLLGEKIALSDSVRQDVSAEYTISGIGFSMEAGMLSAEPDLVFGVDASLQQEENTRHRYIIFPESLEEAGAILSWMDEMQLGGIEYVGQYYQYALFEKIFQFGTAAFRASLIPCACAIVLIMWLLCMKLSRKMHRILWEMQVWGGNTLQTVNFLLGIFCFVGIAASCISVPIMIVGADLIQKTMYKTLKLSYPVFRTDFVGIVAGTEILLFGVLTVIVLVLWLKRPMAGQRLPMHFVKKKLK